MQLIERHSFALSETSLQRRMNSIAKLVNLQLDLARNRPEDFSFLYHLSNLRQYLGYLNAIDPNSQALCRALRLLSLGSRALFGATLTDEETVTLLLDDGESLSVPLSPAREDASADFWFAGYYAALTCRDRATLDILSSVPLSVLRKEESAEESLFLFVEALQAFWKRDENTLHYLERALDATEPARLHIDPDYILYLVVPEMELLFQSIYLDAQRFQRALVRALEQFRLYWNGPDRQTRPQGFLALSSLAYAALAYDLHIPFDVSSDYIPAWIYQGGCALKI